MTVGACVANGTGTGGGVTLPILLTQSTILALKLWPHTQWTCEKDAFHEILYVLCLDQEHQHPVFLWLSNVSFTRELIYCIHLNFNKSDM